MSRFRLAPLVVAATLFIVSTVAAQEAMLEPKPVAAEPKPGATPEVKSPRPPSAKAQEILQRFDKNGDGKLDDDERADAQEAMLKERVDRQMAAIAAGGTTPTKASVAEPERGMFAELEKKLRVAIERDPSLCGRYDKDANGKLEDGEWNAARFELHRALLGPLGANPTPADERKRLEAVAAEVARRRQIREEAGIRVGSRLPPEEVARRVKAVEESLVKNAAAVDETTKQELKSASEEIERRRKAREEAAAQAGAKTAEKKADAK